MKNSKTVYLENNYTPLVVSPETYHHLLAVARTGLVCEICDQPYTKERPQVVRNCCLTCFQTDGHRSLTFLGQQSEHYHWLDWDGYICLSDPGGTATTRDQCETLHYYEFPYPEEYQRENGMKVDLSTYCWHIRGNFRENSVVVLEYEETVRSLHLLVLSYKRRNWVLVDRHRGPTRTLFVEAKRAIESTKENKTWFIHGKPYYKIEEADLCTVVSDLESARYRPPDLTQENAVVPEAEDISVAQLALF